ncbi:MAG: N-acetylmuramoyl-L-alanine amidase family protein [Bacteroidales bacterium]|jgi:N-acetylmuramoyl-L-alanine amidase
MINVRVKYKLLLLIFALIMLPSIVYPQRVNKVVIDAGHGGKDPGAVGKNSREKDITLSIALKLRDAINKELPEVEVVLTRSKDVFVELHRRAKIANNSKADLFISIHCNSAKSKAAHGVETFVMGLQKSAANLEVAKLENASILLEENYVMEYDGFDPTSPEGHIFFSMIQNSFLDKSLEFAGNVQHELVSKSKLHNRGVKQDVFLVLYKTAMPGVLIEVGFISNANEEKYLMSEKGQQNTADAICKALVDYSHSRIKKIENNLASNPEDNIVDTATSKKAESNANVGANEDEITYKVQFLTSSRLISVKDKRFRNIPDVSYYKHNNVFKYTSGKYYTFGEAEKSRKNIVKSGYKDAFVVAFRKDVRINITDEMKKN